MNLTAIDRYLESPVSTMDNHATTTDKKPVIVGIYGVPGTGKTTLLNRLKEQDGAVDFNFYDGSDMINSVVESGLEAFKKMSKDQQTTYRKKAIRLIGNACEDIGKAGVIAGHCMFWTEGDKEGEWIMTDADLATYSHIIYLDVPADEVVKRRKDDQKREREAASVDHLAKWQQEEKKRLRKVCRENGILLSILRNSNSNHGAKTSIQVMKLIEDFKMHDAHTNLLKAQARLNEIMDGRNLETMLVIDGDRTLAADDTGPMFFKEAADVVEEPPDEDNPLRAVFSSQLRYSYIAFRQATLLYEDVAYALGDDDSMFKSTCKAVARSVQIRPEFKSLLEVVVDSRHAGAVVITSGLGYLWKQIVRNAGLEGKVRVVGGGRISDGFVVTTAVKGALVSQLQQQHQTRVWAFGDSVLDFEMLRNADEAVVVVDDRPKQSKTMDTELAKLIKANPDTFKPHQMLVAKEAPPMLSLQKVPKILPEEVRCLVGSPFLLQATMKAAAKLLMTPTRDSGVRGPALQQAHRRVGEYLATEYLTEVIGLEEYPIQHVQQGKSATGHRLFQEEKTLIIALMRGGLPMAEGVNQVFPLATMLHAKTAQDVTAKYLAGASAVILVDSVINEGTTIKEFVEHIRGTHPFIRIVAVAGVVQDDSVKLDGTLQALARKHGRFNVVALRTSENKYKGKGTTDTGHRLFNSTQME